MVVDVKFMEWAATQALDTLKLRAAKVPVYGKWYHPVIPAGLPVVNLKTGEARTFPKPMLAGEILWAAEDDLRRAGFWPPRSAEELLAPGQLAREVAPGESSRAPR